MAAMRHWPLHQLDIKNAFLHSDLRRRFIWSNPLDLLLRGSIALCASYIDFSMGWSNLLELGLVNLVILYNFLGWNEVKQIILFFYCHTSPGKCVHLMVYVDDIVITWNDATKIVQLKEHLFNHFQTKDLGHLKYFLGIEVAQSGDGVVISQRKYALDILEETCMQNYRLVDSPMDPNLKLMADQSEVYPDPERYRRLVGKLIYLTITRPNISFAVGVVSQHMQNPHVDH